MTNDDRPSDPLARALSKLAPVPARLTTPAFYFQAGAAQAALRTSFWRRLCLAQTSLLTMAAGVFAVWLAAAPTPTAINGPLAESKAKPANPLELAPHPREHVAGLPDYRGKPEMIGFRPRLDGIGDAEIAAYIQLRNDIAAAGLGVLPSGPNAHYPFLDGDRGPIGPPVFAVPPANRDPR